MMSKMRGVDLFPKLWKRRTTLELPDGTRCDLLSLPDLVQAKKNQRDKDWPMIRRLVEAHYFQNSAAPNPAQIRFWLRELRTSQLLAEVAQRHTLLCRRLISTSPLLTQAALGKLDEESAEREIDRQYWLPLRAELEQLRHGR